MAQLPEPSGPITSYSDPIYDRLESVAQRVTRRLGFILLAIVVALVIAVIVHNRMHNSPIAASANAYLKADDDFADAVNDRDDTERVAELAKAAKSLQDVAKDTSYTPFFRARALFDLVQLDLNAKDLGSAKDHATQAKDLAVLSNDTDLQLKAGLTEAAVELQSGKYADAASTYDRIEHQAGAKFPDSQIVAVLGAAKALELDGKLTDAATKLEDIIDRVDASAHELILVAREQYWRLKREIAIKAAPAKPAAATKPTAATGSPATAPATAAAPVTGPAAPTTAPAPTATSAAPSAPVTSVPAISPHVSVPPASAPATPPAAPAPAQAATPEGNVPAGAAAPAK